MVETPAPVGRFSYIQHTNKGTPVGRSVPQNLLSWGYLSVPNLLTRSSARIPAYQLSLTIFYDTLLPSVRPWRDPVFCEALPFCETLPSLMCETLPSVLIYIENCATYL